MKAEIYSIKICNSMMEKVHGYYREIIEVYLPSKKITFNEGDDMFNCFTSDRSRYKDAVKVGEIEIPKAMVQAMVNYILACRRLKKTKQWFKRCVSGRNK